MTDIQRYIEFVYLPSFVRSAKGLLEEAEFRVMEQAIIADPEGAPVIADTGGVRKLRLALPGRGKRGGARVIYFYRMPAGRVYLVLVYGKNERENISADDKKAIRAMVRLLEAEQ